MDRNVLVTVNSDPACQNGVMDRNVLVTVNSDPACHTILLHRRSRSFQKSSTVLTSLQKRDLCNKMSMVQIHNSREKQKLPVKVASHHAATSAPLTSGTGTDPSLSSTPSCHRHTVVAEGLEVVSMLLWSSPNKGCSWYSLQQQQTKPNKHKTHTTYPTSSPRHPCCISSLIMLIIPYVTWLAVGAGVGVGGRALGQLAQVNTMVLIYVP